MLLTRPEESPEPKTPSHEAGLLRNCYTFRPEDVARDSIQVPKHSIEEQEKEKKQSATYRSILRRRSNIFVIHEWIKWWGFGDGIRSTSDK